MTWYCMCHLVQWKNIFRIIKQKIYIKCVVLIKLTHGIPGMCVAILKSTYAGAKQQAVITAI